MHGFVQKLDTLSKEQPGTLTLLSLPEGADGPQARIFPVRYGQWLLGRPAIQRGIAGAPTESPAGDDKNRPVRRSAGTVL
jgi:hypothetical protein